MRFAYPRVCQLGRWFYGSDRGSCLGVLTFRKVGIEYVLGKHALGIEKRPVHGNRGTHDLSIGLGLRVEQRQNCVFQLFGQRRDLDVVLIGIFIVADGPARDAFEVPARNESSLLLVLCRPMLQVFCDLLH